MSERLSRSLGTQRRRRLGAVVGTVVLPLALIIWVSALVDERPTAGSPNALPNPVLDTTGHFLLGVAVVLAASYLMGACSACLGQPKVIGEIAAGIALGPSLLGSLSPGAASWLFPPAVSPMLNGLAQLGLILFMFGVGQELGSMRFRGATQQALLVSQASLLVPLAGGTLAAVPLTDRFMGEGAHPVSFVLFVGCALSITALPVLARILSDLDITHTRPGRLSLFVAAVGDAGSWLLLAVVLALAHGSDFSGVLLSTMAALAATGLFLGPLRQFLATWRDGTRQGLETPTVSCLLVIGIATTATLTAAIGIHQLIGALLVGLIWPTRHRDAEAAATPLAATAKTILLPFFFLSFGLGTDFSALHFDTEAVVVLCVLLMVAITAKIVGAGLCARLTGMARPDALTLGVLLNSRGLTELVVLQIGSEAHIINQHLLGILTIVALATTVMTTPVLRLITRRPREDRVDEGPRMSDDRPLTALGDARAGEDSRPPTA
ncbi:cation:proton antiporter [Streptomyces sp. NA02950]|uniref:cation:proton antiporter n=1 Tax=Streptomyces sp. NA02950 TaxID=2742137 RepID=UPI0020CB464C|nr:cation:proton antiporter [Streptomyces sp. NA02950]